MKLYYTKGACSLAVRIIINELGLTSEYVSVDLKSKPKQTETGDDFTKINPKGAVPTLVTNDNQVLTENAVILQYLADQNKATQLLPPVNDFERYRVLEWLNFVATEMHKGLGIFFNPAITQEMKETIFIPLIKTKFNFIDKHLENKNYLLGDQFTLPDAYLFVMLTWTKLFKINVTDWPNLDRYFKELSKRPAIMNSLQQEGLVLSTA